MDIHFPSSDTMKKAVKHAFKPPLSEKVTEVSSTDSSDRAKNDINRHLKCSKQGKNVCTHYCFKLVLLYKNYNHTL